MATSPIVIDVWTVPLDAPGCGGARDRALLAADERARSAAFAFERDRRRFVARRAALRRLLAQSAGCPAAAVRYVAGRHGRPQVAGIALQFSLSHRAERALVAIGKVDRLGVDIERLDPLHAEPGMLDRYVQGEVAAEVNAGLRNANVEPFYRWWTVVEAVAKARGTGITETSPPRAHKGWFDTTTLSDDDGLARRFTVHCWDPEPGLRAALAWSAAGPVALRLHPVAALPLAAAGHCHAA